MNILEINGLTKSYPDFKLGPLELALPAGCIMGLVGENGAGKSTTIRLILQMIRKESGTVSVFGKETAEEMRELKEEIGVVLDEVGLPECLTVEQVERVMRHTYRRWDSAEFDRLIQRLGLPRRKAFKEFSRGMKMKLGIAVALSHHSRLLILDEATSGLDPVVRDEVLEFFREFAAEGERAVLISSHIVSDLEKICTHIAFLHKGTLLLCEEKEALLGRGMPIEELFLSMVGRRDV